MKKAFSLLELLIVIALLGVMTILSVNYYNTTTISKNNTKAQLQSHFEIITAAILQCKELSGIMPIQNDASLASDTFLDSLECNTTTPYQLNGGRNGFIPPPPNGFSEYKATQNNNEFYFSTSTTLNSINDEVLIELNSTYSSQQYELISSGTTRYLKFYLSKN